MALREVLSQLFKADLEAREHHAALVSAPVEELLPVLRAEIAGARGGREEDVAPRLVRIASVLADLEGPAVVDLLVDIANGPSAEARVVAAEALVELGFDRFKEVAQGIERAFERLPAGSPALTELPFVVAEIGEPGGVRVISKLLAHEDAEAVACAIEALSEMGDPSAASALAKLERDTRMVEIEEGGERVSIGDLALEARTMLDELAREVEGRGAGRKGKK